MDYEQSVIEHQTKQIKNEYGTADNIVLKFAEPDGENSNLFFMTEEDMIKNKIITKTEKQ